LTPFRGDGDTAAHVAFEPQPYRTLVAPPLNRSGRGADLPIETIRSQQLSSG
jgi:hypothetical protein